MEEVHLFCIEEGHDASLNDISMHKIDIVNGKIKEYKTKNKLILGGITKYFQPLDVSINKPFRMSWRRGTLNIV